MEIHFKKLNTKKTQIQIGLAKVRRFSLMLMIEGH